MHLLRRGASHDSGCLVCRVRRKKCVLPVRDDMCKDCRKFWIQCTGVGAARPSSNCEKEIIKLTKKWIKGYKTVNRALPPRSLSHLIQSVAPVAHAPPPPTEEPPPAPALEGASTPVPLVASELPPGSGPADPLVPFPEPPPRNDNVVWDMQQLKLAPTFYNLHNPTSLITDPESPTSPRIVVQSITGEINGNLDDPGFPEASASSSSNLSHPRSYIYQNWSSAGSGSSLNDPSNSPGTRSTYSSDPMYDFEGHGGEEHPHERDDH